MRVPNFNIEHHRVKTGYHASTNLMGNNGQFRYKCNGVDILVIASDGMGWEHVSVSCPGKKRCPTWEEMCWVKRQFWDDEECVIQFHPPRSRYVNNHPFVLHMWKPSEVELPMPPEIFIGLKSAGVIKNAEQARQIDRDLNVIHDSLS